MFPCICCLPLILNGWRFVHLWIEEQGLLLPLWPETPRCFGFANMSLIWKYVCSVLICKRFSVSIALHESWLERVWNVAKNCHAQPKRWFNQYCQSQTTFNDYRKGISSAVFWWNLSSDNKRYHQARWSILIFTVDILFQKVKM